MEYVFGGSFICKVRRGSAAAFHSALLSHCCCRLVPITLPPFVAHKRPPFVPPQQDAGTAKKLAFAREVSTRCITLEGDDFNPGGTLTGGSRNKGNSVLVRREAGFGRVQS